MKSNILKASNAKWRANGQKGAVIAARHDVPGLFAQVTAGKTSGTNWHAEFECFPFAIVQGARYEASFVVRGEAAMPAQVWITQAKKPWRNVGLSEPFQLASEFQAFRFDFCGTATEDEARIVFSLGAADNVVYFKEVALRRVDA